MYAIRKPKGLIRYASERSISNPKKKLLNARAIAYSIVLFLLIGVVTVSFINRGDVETTIIRTQGTMFQEYGTEAYSNLYNLQMINKTNEVISLQLKLLSHEGEIKILGDELNVNVGEVAKRNLLIILNKDLLKSSNTHINIGIYADGEAIEELSSTFVGPNSLDK